MRILNIVFNAEIKYQQYAKLRKYRHKDFRSNFDPGKTHKGKTSERGLCIIYELLRNSFTAYSSSDIYTNLSGLSFTKILLNNPGKCSSISVPEIHTTVWLSQQLMLYGLSQNLCQNSAKIVRKTQHEQLLVNRDVRSPRFVPNYMDYTEIHSEIYYSSYLNFCANKCCMAALECMPILSEIAAAVLLNFCAH
jgi:hypothetical protein